jgi:ribosomal protein S5
MVEIPRLQAKRSFVMPAQAGIQVRFGKAQRAVLDSAGMTGRAKVDFESTPTKSLGFEPRVV